MIAALCFVADSFMFCVLFLFFIYYVYCVDCSLLHSRLGSLEAVVDFFFSDFLQSDLVD